MAQSRIKKVEPTAKKLQSNQRKLKKKRFIPKKPLTISLGCFGCGKQCQFGGLFCAEHTPNPSEPYRCNELFNLIEVWRSLLKKIENKQLQESGVEF